MRATDGLCGESHQSNRRADQGTSQLSTVTLKIWPTNKASQNGTPLLVMKGVVHQDAEDEHHGVEHHQHQHAVRYASTGSMGDLNHRLRYNRHDRRSGR
jgi:hypothetical protein